MENVKRIYVEKKEAFAVKARELEDELKGYLGIAGLKKVRIFIRYDVENLSEEVFEKACRSVFSEPPVDDLYMEDIEMPADSRCFSVEFLPGQFDQRADSAVQCVQFLNEDEQPVIKTAVSLIRSNGTVSILWTRGRRGWRSRTHWCRLLRSRPMWGALTDLRTWLRTI